MTSFLQRLASDKSGVEAGRDAAYGRLSGDGGDGMDALTAEEWGIIALSLKVSAAAVLGSLPIAFGIAWLLARARFPGKLLVDGLVHLPLVVPPVVTGWLLLIAFGNNGPVGRWLEASFGISLMFRWTGAALAAAVMALPLMVRAMRLSIEAVDTRLEGAARTLGAGPWRAFATVTLPLALPGVVAGAVLGFARSIGEFGATITFVSNIPGETRTLPLAIYSSLQLPGGEAVVMRLALIAVVLSLVALVLSEWLARRAGAGRGTQIL
jgi:molybdate transport system permease protein